LFGIDTYTYLILIMVKILKKTDINSENAKNNFRLSDSNVILVGCTGAGKSTVGFHLAKLLGFGLFDLDAAIERTSGQSIGQIFQSHGLKGFRELESKMVVDLANVKNQVIVVGAGALENEENFAALKALGIIVWMDVDSKEVARRLMADQKALESRPLFSEAVSITDMAARQCLPSGKGGGIAKYACCPVPERLTLHVTCTFATASACALWQSKQD
jgi:shikimate kinase